MYFLHHATYINTTYIGVVYQHTLNLFITVHIPTAVDPGVWAGGWCDILHRWEAVARSTVRQITRGCQRAVSGGQEREDSCGQYAATGPCLRYSLDFITFIYRKSRLNFRSTSTNTYTLYSS